MQCKHSKAIDVEALRKQIARLEGTRRRHDEPPVSSGCKPLDRLLPEGGFAWGSLVEWLVDGGGIPAESLALGSACQACRRGGALIVLDCRGEFYPPAAARLAVDLDRLILVRAATAADDAWALDQSLRCAGVSAVLAWPERLDGRTFRRLQLAVEEGGGLGVLVRPAAAQAEPSWADVRLLVESLPRDGPARAAAELSSQHKGRPSGAGRRVRIHLLRCRRLAAGRKIDVEIDDETHTVHLVAPLVEATTRRQVRGA